MAHRTSGPAGHASVHWNTEQRTLTLEGEPVLEYRLSWPQVSGGGLGGAWISRYYRALARAWKVRWDREVYWQACLDLAQRRASSRPFVPWQGELSGEVTLWQDGMVSIRMTGWERRGGQNPNRVRWGDVWRVREGAPVPLRDFFPRQRRWRQALCQQILQLGRARKQAGESVPYPDWEQKVSALFPEQSYCLTADGLEFAYPQNTLTSAAEGTPVFCLPLPSSASPQAASDRSRRPAKFF